MARTQWSKAELKRLVDAYEASGLTRREFSRSRGIEYTAFDYYQRRLRQLEEQEQSRSRQRAPQQAPVAQELAPVQITPETAASGSSSSSHNAIIIITVGNGRKIECAFTDLHDVVREESLTQLIRIVERA